MTLALPDRAAQADRPVRVMLCDDSPTVRSAFARILESDPAVQVVARVGDGQQALDTLHTLPRETRPQVMLLDLEMPVMDGMTALPLLLKAQPSLAVIVASALTQRGAEVTMAAMRAGAADYVPKPRAAEGGMSDPGFRAELLAKVKGWARMRAPPTQIPGAVSPPAPPRPGLRAPSPLAGGVPVGMTAGGPAGLAAAAPQRALAGAGKKPRLLAIGSSTGGPQALAGFVRRLTTPLPVPIVIVQHMPAGFTAMLADHLSRLGGPQAAEAKEGEALLPGRIYVAPGDRHLLVEAAAAGLQARLTMDPPENFCRPAVDPMLRSAAKACEGRVLAVILTGMGQDGMLGCKAVAAAGGMVLAQDEASSVVWGMPGAVAKAGLAQALLPPEQLADKVLAQFGTAGLSSAGGVA
ncbi:chemotaxis response regulator protein-glutamate methylesterase [Pseudoroseomonas cervicalis]|uniref:protein-glutamate methylesterase/protein-glutamine glutaminase n=1 Tax=Teichococcus cervicalis TaxID=204525 RepID=UPI0027864DE5|nr:chemotaxis response regulator protein-glutamate methylesterase [Pseudoroseomonas cervicalis]MDQ1078336.1 two-component system chemotaxis response regulator CheB [Pseudoroseomonas cervicalis]